MCVLFLIHKFSERGFCSTCCCRVFSSRASFTLIGVTMNPIRVEVWGSTKLSFLLWPSFPPCTKDWEVMSMRRANRPSKSGRSDSSLMGATIKFQLAPGAFSMPVRSIQKWSTGKPSMDSTPGAEAPLMREEYTLDTSRMVVTSWPWVGPSLWTLVSHPR